MADLSGKNIFEASNAGLGHYRMPGADAVSPNQLHSLAKLCVRLSDLCGFDGSSGLYRKVRKGFRKVRKANCTSTACRIVG
jgi:hypothetical protein